MSRKRIEMILKIHQSITKPLYDVLNGITNEQFNWKPAPESRSINEIFCHLIRVDNSFLKRMGEPVQTEDPKNGSSSQVLNALQKVHRQIFNLISGCSNDSDLFKVSKIEDAKETDTINWHFLHSPQHNLYHLSQTIYLRRALDRSWNSPIDDWDKATRIIASFLNPAEYK